MRGMPSADGAVAVAVEEAKRCGVDHGRAGWGKGKPEEDEEAQGVAE